MNCKHFETYTNKIIKYIIDFKNPTLYFQTDIVIFGFAFKDNTDDIRFLLFNFKCFNRHSLALKILNKVLQLGNKKIVLFDPYITCYSEYSNSNTKFMGYIRHYLNKYFNYPKAIENSNNINESIY